MHKDMHMFGNGSNDIINNKDIEMKKVIFPS